MYKQMYVDYKYMNHYKVKHTTLYTHQHIEQVYCIPVNLWPSLSQYTTSLNT